MRFSVYQRPSGHACNDTSADGSEKVDFAQEGIDERNSTLSSSVVKKSK